ncbi:metal-sulfur cluster assembly factor, partial [candidate division KSB1 bacterium]|nr:metal-sulfur cluster assembly factor [candidate division KSB1 bacterium]
PVKSPLDEKAVWQALTEVMDPELPISVVDMGLIYSVTVAQNTIDIEMTFTAIACPAMDMMIGDIRDKIDSLATGVSTRVSVVWNPPWTKARLTERGKEVLQSLGIAT